MECAELEANLTDFLDGILDPLSEAAALEHLATCERCETVLSQTRSVITLANRHGRIELETVERKDLLRRILSAESPAAPLDGSKGRSRNVLGHVEPDE